MTTDDRLRLGLGAWIVVAALLLLVAPPPPPPPITNGEDEAIFQRTVDNTVDKARLWQAERGDRTIAWDDVGGHLAIVITGVGDELHLFEQLLALRFPLGFSVRPDAAYTPGVQLRLRGDRRRPREILLHLPCERTDPPARPREALEAALGRVPGAVGVECATASWSRDTVAEVLGERGLIALDVAPALDVALPAVDVALPALDVALPVLDVALPAAITATLAADLQLDEDPAPAAVLAQLERAAQRARDRPTVVVARPSQVVVETLREGLPRLHREGIGVYPLREILARRGPASAQ